MQKVYVPKSPHEKAMQRALIQYRNPELYDLVIEALHKAGRSVRKDKTILNTEEELKGKIRRNPSEMFILRRIENRYI